MSVRKTQDNTNATERLIDLAEDRPSCSSPSAMVRAQGGLLLRSVSKAGLGELLDLDDEKRHMIGRKGERSINRAPDGSKTADVDVTDSQINITAGKEIPALI